MIESGYIQRIRPHIEEGPATGRLTTPTGITTITLSSKFRAEALPEGWRSSAIRAIDGKVTRDTQILLET
jgi:hypothetical protein